jgi:cysteine synthase A
LNYVAAARAAKAAEPGTRIVTVFPDRMERYFTTRLFDHCRNQGDKAGMMQRDS